MFEIFGLLKEHTISLDIYGDGPLYNKFQSIIHEGNLNIRLCGSATLLPEVYNRYNYFIQASSHEGFGLSVAEAMASGLPCLLSDIPVFHEVTGDNAFFFPLNDPQKASEIILSSLMDSKQADKFSQEGITLARQKFSPQVYKQNILSIYHKITKGKIN